MTKIEWTDRTWNPIIGCSHVSPGCDHCYAEKMACRLARMPGKVGETYSQVVDLDKNLWKGRTAFVPSTLEKPLHWKKPKRIFVGSMTDLFHPSVPDEWLDRVFATMALCPQHTFQILTKRPERMLEYISSLWVHRRVWKRVVESIGFGHQFEGKWVDDSAWPLSNVWLGVTAENKAMADKRIPVLLQTPAEKRFVSLEPLLKAVDLSRWMHRTQGWTRQDPVYRCPRCGATGWGHYFSTYTWGDDYDESCHACGYGSTAGDVDFPEIGNIDWVILGGESGPNARPMHPDWALDVRDQCTEAGVPFFFKQWGEWAPHNSKAGIIPTNKTPWGTVDRDGKFWPETTPWNSERGGNEICVVRVGKRRAGHLLDGVEHREFPV